MVHSTLSEKSNGENKSKNSNKLSSVDDKFTVEVLKLLFEFRSSSDSVFTFEAKLSSSEWAIVHDVSQELGLVAKSTGSRTNRSVSVHKFGKKKKISRKGRYHAKTLDSYPEPKRLPTLDLSKEAKTILTDLFRQYPSREDETAKQNICKDVYKSSRKKDDFFCRPEMDGKQIAKNVKSFVDRVKKDPRLKQIFKKKSEFPIASFRNDIISTIAEHQVVLISGEPSCGKTTQVPQLLLDHMWAQGKACKIVCTQPQHISATSVAERVSEERGESIGETVGYKTRMESKGGRQSSIVFCTNEIMLSVLQPGAGNGSQSTGNDMSELTHIILDEIHERDWHSDIIIAILRDLLPTYPHLRLALMSATLGAERFSEYFGGCPIIQVPGHPVKSYYLDDILTMVNIPSKSHKKATSSISPVNLKDDYCSTLDNAIEIACSNEDLDPLLELIYADISPKVLNYQHSSSGMNTLMLVARKGRVGDVCTLLCLGADCHLQASDGTTALDCAKNQPEIADILQKHMENITDKSKEENLKNSELLDFNLIKNLLKKLCSELMDGTILVLLPSWDSINKTRDKLLAKPYFQNSSKFMILPLHSWVPPIELKKVFEQPPRGCLKIVLSTDISETRVTVDDVVYVIDSGRIEVKSYDPYSNVSILKTCWISEASAKQRERCAGCHHPGVCYRLYSELRMESFQPFQVPEIMRMPLEELCLKVKILDPNCKIVEFLKKTLDPPPTESLNNAISVLKDIGALSSDEQLTELGSKLGSLPVHPQLGKMLIFAVMVNCLDPALTLACGAHNIDLFVQPVSPTERKKLDAAKAELAALYGGWYSDHLVTIAAFDCWRIAKEKGVGPMFCSQYFVSLIGMDTLARARELLLDELIRVGFITADDVATCSMNARNPGILRAILFACFYPMVGKLVKLGKSNECLVETVFSNKVIISNSSVNDGCDKQTLVVFDELISDDSGDLLIRNCIEIGSLVLLLMANEIDVDCDKDGMEVDRLSLLCSDKLVSVIVDRWLVYELTEVQVGWVYCLRERLSSAILFKVANPNRVLPPELRAFINTITYLFSLNGSSGTSPSTELLSDVTPNSSLLTSLMKPGEIEVIRMEAEARRMAAEARRKAAETRRKEAEARLARAKAGPAVEPEPVVPPGDDESSKLKSRKRKRKERGVGGSEPIEASSVVAA